MGVKSVMWRAFEAEKREFFVDGGSAGWSGCNKQAHKPWSVRLRVSGVPGDMGVRNRFPVSAERGKILGWAGFFKQEREKTWKGWLTRSSVLDKRRGPLFVEKFYLLCKNENAIMRI